MKIKRPAILVTKPHPINVGATNKGAMNCARSIHCAQLRYDKPEACIMKIKRPAILVTKPHAINMGATNKGAKNCAPTPRIVGAQFIAPNCATINLMGVHYEN